MNLKRSCRHNDIKQLIQIEKNKINKLEIQLEMMNVYYHHKFRDLKSQLKSCYERLDHIIQTNENNITS
jgi:hypothetical protein